MGFPVLRRHGPTRILGWILGLVLLATLVAGCSGGAVGQSPSSDDLVTSGARQAAFQLEAVPSAPTNLRLDSLTPEEAQVSWTDNSSDETGFIIEIELNHDEDWMELERVGANTTAYRIGVLAPGIRTRVRVRAYNASGQSANSNLLAFTPSELPGTPQGLSAATPSSTEVFLSWQSSPVASGGFRVERQTGTGPFLEIATTPGNEPRYLDTGLTPGTPYTYRVRAYNDAGTSGYSNTVTVTPGDDPNPVDPPAAPTNVAVEVVPPTGIALTWTDNATDEDGYYIERRVEDGVFTRIATLGPDQTRFDDTGLSTDTTYTYLVLSFNSGGTSAGQPQPMVVVPSLPLAPSDLNAVLQSATEVELQWVNNAFNAEGVAIEQKSGSGDFVQVGTVDGLTTSWSDVSLVPGTVYTWRVRAYNNAGTSPWSNLATVTPPSLPAAPSGLSAAAASTTQVSLAWTDNSVDEDGFRIEVRTEDGDFTEWATLGAGVSGHTLNDLAPGATYTFRVRAFNLVGSSAWSNEASVRLVSPPSPPTDLTATVISTTRVDLNWRDHSADETGFEIHRRVGAGGFVALATVSSGVETWTDTTAQVEGTCVYRVRAQNEAGNSDWSNEATASLPDPPGAPSGLKATATSPTRVELTWQNPGTDPDDLEVERRIGQDAFTLVATVPGHADNWADEGLSPGTTATYRVRARNSSGSSGWSNEASATTLGVPQAPTGLRAVPWSGSEVRLDWTDNSDNEEGFKVERKGGGGDFLQVHTAPAGTTSFTDHGLNPGTAYTYRVRAYNQAGDSAYTSEASATTRPGLASPTGLQATAASSTQVDLTWTDNSDNENGFKVERRAGSGPFVEINRPPSNVTTLSVFDLTPDTLYTFRVRAFDASGDSEWSNEASTTTTAAASIPAAPTALTATAASTTRVNLSWTDNSGNEEGFRIERRDGAGDFVLLADVPPDTTAYADDGLTPGTTYTYRVRAHNPIGDSDWSNEAPATPLVGPQAPVSPTNLTATLSSGHVLLRWSDNSSDETGFRLERQVGQGPFQELATLGANSTSFTDSAPILDPTCTYRVLAFNGEALSGYSNLAPALASSSRLVLGLGDLGKGWIEAFDLVADGEPVHADWLGAHWPAYSGSIPAPAYPASGDVDGDGLQELVVGLGARGQGRVLVLDDATTGHTLLGWLQVSWPAYNNSGEAPTHPTCADLDGDGIDEVVVGLGDLGQGWVQVFQHGGGGQFHPFLDNGGWAQVQWTDYTTSGKAPVWPTGGDFNADGRDEVALGLGSGGRGWTQILTCNGSALVPFAATAPFSDEGWVSVGWSTYQASGEASIYPAAGDLDHDGKADLVLGLGGNAAGWLRVFRSTGGGFEPMPGTANADGWLQVPWRAYTEAPQASTRPTCGDLNGDGGDDLAVGLGPDGQGWVYTLQGRTFIPAEGPGFYGWLQVRWGAYLEAQAPTWPTILNQRSAPLSFQDLSQPPCRPGGPDPDLPRRTA